MSDNSVDIMLEGVRIAFPNVHTPKRVGDDGGPRYSCALLIDPDSEQLKKAKKALKKVVEKKWGDKAGQVLKQLVAADRVCLRNGDTKSDYDGFPGMYFVSASSKVRPLVIDADKTPLSEEDGKPYAGCYVNAKIQVWAQDKKDYGKRINAQLQGVQFASDGEPFGGGRPADVDEFTELEGVDEDDEFGGESDDGDDDDGFGDLI